ncbi:MAG: HAD family hydrolase [Desulforhabdus sp.]|nr:HAD family hydrolase [Desulforhabdus sp.]
MISLNGTQFILFDLDGTLRHNQPSSEHAFFDFAVQLGAEDSPARRRSGMRWSHYYWAQSPVLLNDLVTYKNQEELFWINYAFRHLLSFGCSKEQATLLAKPVQEQMEKHYKPEDVVYPSTIETLQQLRQAGFTLGVVTNRRDSCDEQLSALGLKEFMDVTVVAGKVSAWKPDPAIFEHALKMLKASPEQVIYVGDNYFADIVGARRAGIRPVLIDPEGVFTEPECTVITSIEELLTVLEQQP